MANEMSAKSFVVICALAIAGFVGLMLVVQLRPERTQAVAQEVKAAAPIAEVAAQPKPPTQIPVAMVPRSSGVEVAPKVIETERAVPALVAVSPSTQPNPVVTRPITDALETMRAEATALFKDRLVALRKVMDERNVKVMRYADAGYPDPSSKVFVSSANLDCDSASTGRVV
jgi:hypothetical protein